MSAPEVRERTRTITERVVTLTDPGREATKYAEAVPPSEVEIVVDDLYPLAEQGQWDSQFGEVLLWNDPSEQRALEAQGWLKAETKGGVHGTDTLRAWLKGYEELT